MLFPSEGEERTTKTPMFGQTLRRLFVPITASRNQSTVAAQKVSVNAYFVARRLNLKNVQAVEDVFETPSPKPNEFEKKYVIETIDASKHQHILVFKFGSVVFLNVPEERQLWHLRRITKGSLPHKSTTEGFIAEGSQLTEDYKIMVHEKLDKPSVFKAQHVNILSLNKQNMEIICTVVAQSVALKYCAKQVGKMLERFMEINKVIEDTGSISQIEGAKYKDLKKLVAENNTVICNVIYELGIFEGTDAGWDSSECHETWEGLRREFQIDLRFKGDANLR